MIKVESSVSIELRFWWVKIFVVLIVPSLESKRSKARPSMRTAISFSNWSSVRVKPAGSELMTPQDRRLQLHYWKSSYSSDYSVLDCSTQLCVPTVKRCGIYHREIGTINLKTKWIVALKLRLPLFWIWTVLVLASTKRLLIAVSIPIVAFYSFGADFQWQHSVIVLILNLTLKSAYPKLVWNEVEK